MASEQRGSEMFVFQDEKTGRTIWRLTNSQREDKHTYYDICPWSGDQRYIVFSSGDPRYLTIPYGDNLAACRSEVCIMDTENDYSITTVADDGFFTTHTGTSAKWNPKEKKIYYYKAPNRVVALNIATGERERVIEGAIRQLSPDGETFVWNCNDPEYGEGRGVYLMDEDGTNVRMVVSTEELYELTPNRDAFDLEDMMVQNTKWRPDGEYILLVSRIPKGEINNYWKHMYIISADGSEKRWLTDYGHHHSWTPDGERILYSDWKDREPLEGLPREIPRLYLIDFDGSNKHMVIDEPLGGHPIMDPSGTMITTWDREGVILARLEEQTVEYLASFGDGFSMSHQGTHPHCVWSPDGSQILYNSAQTGHSEIYLIPMEA